MPLVSDFYGKDSPVRTVDLTQLYWGDLLLSNASAAGVQDALQQRAAARVTLITDSDFSGQILGWKIRAGALEFEFEPLARSQQPDKSRLVHLSFYFSLPHSFPLLPALAPA